VKIANLIRHVSLRRLRMHKGHTVMSILGIALGVSAIVSIGIVSQSVVLSFEDTVTKIGGKAALQVQGPESGFPEEMLDTVRKISGVEQAVPVIEAQVSIPNAKEPSLTILGIDVLQDGNMRDYRMSDESAEIPDPLLFLAKPDSILLTRALAKRESITIDQAVTIETVRGMRNLHIRGLLDPEGPAKAVAGNIAVMDLYAAQMLLGREDRIDRIDISLYRGEDVETIRQRIKSALPEGYTVDTAAGRARRFDAVLSSFRRVISTIGLVALLAGMYLIYNAVSISVVQRRREIGILRALGAGQKDIIRLFLAEALAIALSGSLLGVGAGILFARLSLASFSQSIAQLYQYAYAGTTTLNYSWHYPLAGLCVGLVSGLFAAFFPVRSASRIAPISAIRSIPYPDGGRLTNAAVTSVSAGCFVVMCILIAVFTTVRYPGKNVVFGIVFLAEILLMLGVTLALPNILHAFISLFHRFLSPRLGASARLAGLNIQKSINRNAVASGAVFLGLSLFVAISSIVFSMQESISRWLTVQTSCDLLVTMGHPFTGLSEKSIPMPPEIRKEIDGIPGVAITDVYRKAFVAYKDSKILLESIDVKNRLAYASFLIVRGDVNSIADMLPGQDNVILSESMANRNGLKPGDTLSLATPGGPVSFGIAAVVVDYSYEYGAVIMDNNTYRRHWNDALADGIAVKVSDIKNLPMVRSSILDALKPRGNPYAVTLAEWNSEVRSLMDRTYASFHALNIMTLSIACIGIVITLLASVLERTREIGIIRSLGGMRSQVSRIVVTEAVLLGLLGGLLGIAAGTLLGWMAIRGIVGGEVGTTMQYVVDYRSFLWAMLLSICLSALAGLYPARRAAKTNVVEALAYE
jgi:putative ABC transport system permease protein